MIQNIVVGFPIVEPWTMFAKTEEEFESDKAITLFTQERFLPELMMKAGMGSSKGEIRRNKPELVRRLEALDYLEVKWGKKRLFILVGYDTEEERNKKIQELETEE